MLFALGRVDELCVRIVNEDIRRTSAETISEKERRVPVGGQGCRRNAVWQGWQDAEKHIWQVRVHGCPCARLVGKVRIWGGMTATCPEHVCAPAARTGRVGPAAALATTVGGQKRKEPTAAQAAKELRQDCRASVRLRPRLRRARHPGHHPSQQHASGWQPVGKRLATAVVLTAGQLTAIAVAP